MAKKCLLIVRDVPRILHFVSIEAVVPREVLAVPFDRIARRILLGWRRRVHHHEVVRHADVGIPQWQRNSTWSETCLWIALAFDSVIVGRTPEMDRQPVLVSRHFVPRHCCEFPLTFHQNRLGIEVDGVGILENERPAIDDVHVAEHEEQTLAAGVDRSVHIAGSRYLQIGGCAADLGQRLRPASTACLHGDLGMSGTNQREYRYAKSRDYKLSTCERHDGALHVRPPRTESLSCRRKPFLKDWRSVAYYRLVRRAVVLDLPQGKVD